MPWFRGEASIYQRSGLLPLSTDVPYCVTIVIRKDCDWLTDKNNMLITMMDMRVLVKIQEAGKETELHKTKRILAEN